MSRILTLIGGGPQGTLEYLVQSDDNTATVEPDDRYKYIDDLSVLQLVLLSGLLVEYDIRQHVTADVGTDMKYLQWDQCTQANSEASNNSSKHKFYIF